MTLIFSRNGWVRARQGWGVDPAALSFKEGDELQSLITCRTVDPVIFLDSRGRAYTVEVGQLPSSRGDGVPASSLVDLQDGAKMMFCLAGKADTPVLVATSGGYGFLCRIADMMSNRRAGREFMTMEESETPVAPCLFAESPSNYVATLSEQGRMLLFQMTELKYQPKGRGMILMGLDKNEKMVAAMVSDQQKLVVMGTVRGKPNTVLVQGKELGQYAGHRTRMGKMLPDKIKPTALKLYTSDPAKS